MLAPKKVQEQYMSTNTTSKLNTYNLLEDGSRKPGGGADKSGSRGASFLEKEMQREKEKEKDNAKKAKANDKNKDKKKERVSYSTESTESSTTTSTTTSSAGSVDPSSSHIMSAPVRATTARTTFAPSPKTIVKLQPASGPSSPETSTPDHSVNKLLDEDQVSPVSVVNHIRGHRDSIDCDEHLPMRTPHAKAFGTLDLNDIEHPHRAQKPSDGGSSFANCIFRRFRGVSSGSGLLPTITLQLALDRDCRTGSE